MNLLLDEMFASEVANALNVLTYRHNCIYSAIVSLAAGAADEDIPTLCQKRGFAALVTANVRDFGAKLVLYEALLAAGVSVVVVRSRATLGPETQLSLVSAHSLRIAKALDGGKTVLLRLTQGGVVERTLEELRKEVAGNTRHLP